MDNLRHFSVMGLALKQAIELTYLNTKFSKYDQLQGEQYHLQYVMHLLTTLGENDVAA